MEQMILSEPLPDLQSLKARQKAIWETGDFGQIARYNEPAAEEFMARLPLQRGMRVLDVACGTGSLALIAARQGCVVTGLDIASNLVAQARARAAQERLPIEFHEGDAEALPYGPASFDAVLSMYGVMFAPRAEVAAAELLRVTKPGGFIGLANWTPEGFIGKMFTIFSAFSRPVSGMASPLLWGTEEAVQSRLGRGAREFRFSRRKARLRYPFDPAGTVEFFRQYYGPTRCAFASLDKLKQLALRLQLEQLQSEHNISALPDTTETLAEYLQVIAYRNPPMRRILV
jgi:SAM-dependent methyltransferase